MALSLKITFFISKEEMGISGENYLLFIFTLKVKILLKMVLNTHISTIPYPIIFMFLKNFCYFSVGRSEITQRFMAIF
jgi:hypothetical protein